MTTIIVKAKLIFLRTRVILMMVNMGNILLLWYLKANKLYRWTQKKMKKKLRALKRLGG